MNASPLRITALCLAALLLVGAAASQPDPDPDPAEKPADHGAVKVQYLEIVTPLVDATCEALAKAHGVEFGEPIPQFGNARTANLEDGGWIGVRAPMRATETPVVRPYVLVDDIEAAVRAAQEAGATVALPPMPIPGYGMFSIYILGGIEHGLWQH